MENKKEELNRDLFYIFATKPLLKYKKDQYIDYFVKRGYNVHILDLSPILNPEAYKLVIDGIISDDDKIVFSKKKEFRRYMKNTPDGAMFFVRANYYYETFFVHKAIRKNQFYGYFGCANRAIEVPTLSFNSQAREFAKRITLHHIIASIFHRIPMKYIPVKKADFVIMGGTGVNKEDINRLLNICCHDKNTIICYFHSSDYEDYLDAEFSDRLINDRYCVYIDQYLPFHPDCLQEGIQIEPIIYYEHLRDFFEYITIEYKIKVVIAAHPRANFEHEKELFYNYDVIKGRTAELVKDSEFVFTHMSTCLCLAPLFHIPFFIITSEEVDKIEMYKKQLRYISDYLNCPLFDISDSKWRKTFRIPSDYDHERAVKYIQEYVKADYNEDAKDEIRFAVRLEKLINTIMFSNEESKENASL